MVIFLSDENKSKANVDLLVAGTKGDTVKDDKENKEDDKEDNGNGESKKKEKTEMPRPASIHAAVNSPSKIYFKAVASNKKLPPAVIYYHSLSSNKQIKDHSVRLPTPVATAATIYYHSLDSNKNHKLFHSKDDPPSPKGPGRSTLSWHQHHVGLHHELHHSSTSVGASKRRGSHTGTGRRGSHGSVGAKSVPSSPHRPPLSPTSPPPSYIHNTSKMLVKGGAFQQHHVHSHAQATLRHPPSPQSPSARSLPPHLPLTQEKPPTAAKVTPQLPFPGTAPVPLHKPSSLLRQRKYHRDESRPLVNASSTLSSKSSSHDDQEFTPGGCNFLGAVSSMVMDATNPHTTEIQLSPMKPKTNKDNSNASQGSGSSVSFGKIEIVDFPIRLGDNPSVRFGAPIALGTTPLGRRTLTLEEYEQDRASRLGRNEIVLDVMVRSDMLKQSGFSQKEIRKAISEAAQARESRKKHAEKFLKEHGWGSILASTLDASEDGSSTTTTSKSLTREKE